MTERGVGIVTYNRAKQIGELIEAVQSTTTGVRIVVADDGSTDETPQIVASFPGVLYVRGPNRGVAHNKNRALAALQDCAYVALLEDDLFPVTPGWFDLYQAAAAYLGVHHFCRVQDKEVKETIPACTEALSKYMSATPIYGASPRGDLTFVTRRALQVCGGLHPEFLGAGHAHGEWSERVARAGLLQHPLKWMDIREARDCFEQRGDTEGGRWAQDPEKTKEDLARNKGIARQLRRKGLVHVPLEMR